MSEDGKDVRLFKVLSDDESAKVELSPDHKGFFSMFVFREGAAGLLRQRCGLLFRAQSFCACALQAKMRC